MRDNIMNNTEKKLDALIDALGFDVEETMTGDHRTFGCWIDFKFTKRDEPVEENKTITVPHALNMLSKRDRDIVDNVRMAMGSLGESVDDEPTVNLAATEAFKNVPCTARTTIASSTILKRELLKILETAGKKPKKGTITIIEHAIDKAFKS
jgi:hypothetical protein